MKIKTAIILASMSASILCLAPSCDRSEPCPSDKGGGGLLLELRTADDYAPALKSSIITDEDKVYDVNVWIYNERGRLTDSCFESGNPLFTTYGNLNLTMLTNATGYVVVVANAGRELTAPHDFGSSCSVSMLYDAYSASSQGVLAAGNGVIIRKASGTVCPVTLSRVMSRIAMYVDVSAEARASGAVMGSNVRVKSARLRNVAATVDFVPSAVFSTARVSRVVDAAGLRDCDCLSASDLSSVNSGGVVYLYALPNYTNAAYVPTPSESTVLSTYIEITVAYDAFSGKSAGEVVCRFYASDKSVIGLLGGCSYNVGVSLSEDGGTAIWRKDDGRITVPGNFVPGETKIVSLVQDKPSEFASDYTWSLSPNSTLSTTDLFSISSDVTDASGSLVGVKVKALEAGSGTLYLRNASGIVVGETAITSVFPALSARNVTIDVVGTPDMTSLTGLPDASLFASPEDFNAYYGVRSFSAGTTDGIDGAGFISGRAEDLSVYVSQLHWNSGGTSLSWENVVGKTFPVDITLNCGRTVGFRATVTDSVVGPLASDEYLGEMFNITEVDDPNDEVASLPKTLVAALNAPVPASLYSGSISDAASEGWRTWAAGAVADGWIISRSPSSIWWNLPEELGSTSSGGSHAIRIGKLNPHCGEYVVRQAGWFHITAFHPVGLEVYTEIIGPDILAYCFRPHESVFLDCEPVIDVESAYKERRWEVLNYINHVTGIGSNGYHAFNNYYEVNFRLGDGCPFYSDLQYMRTDALAKTVLIDSFAVTYPAGAYGSELFGGTGEGSGSRNLPIYILSPYCCIDPETGAKKPLGVTEVAGHHGSVVIEKWACSTKAYWNWPEGERMKNN